MGPRLRDDAGALAEALSRANEARDAHGTLRTLEVDDDGTFVTLGLRIDDETSVSVVLMFEVRSRGDARAPSPPMRRERRDLGTAGKTKDLVWCSRSSPTSPASRGRVSRTTTRFFARALIPSARRLPRACRLTARALPSSRPQSIASPRSARPRLPHGKSIISRDSRDEAFFFFFFFL